MLDSTRKHKFVLKTEESIRAFESFIPSPIPKRREWTMWRDITSDDEQTFGGFRLDPVVSTGDWEVLAGLRREIEKAYNLTDETILEKIIEDIQTKSRELNGQWFLFCHSDQYVGSIGVVPFTFDGERIGRIQDVDIIPSCQGKGFGSKMLKMFFAEMKRTGLKSLCLMAIENDWPKDWYLRNGFSKLEQT